MTSDQAKQQVENEKKEAAEEKERIATEAAKVKAQSNIGEKKKTDTEEVPVAKCPSELKKEKADADKATKEAE